MDPQLYPEVAQSYYEDTSPAESADDEDSDDDAFGKVHPSRMGEGFIVDSAAAALGAASWAHRQGSWPPTWTAPRRQEVFA